MQRALFVYGHEPDPTTAMNWLREWLPVFGPDQVEGHLLYVGNEDDAPDLTAPRHPRIEWRRAAQPGTTLKVILKYIEDNDIQLVATMNRRSRGLVGRIKGRLSEQVLRYSQRPLLLLPQI